MEERLTCFEGSAAGTWRVSVPARLVRRVAQVDRSVWAL